MSEADLKRVLVFGDWVIDEYWVTSIHRSRTASRIGKAYRRALHELSGAVQSLGGAGRVATVLGRASGLEDRPLFSVTGFGVWHSQDTAMIQSLLDPSQASGITPFRLSATPPAPTSSSWPRPQLHNLARFVDQGGVDRKPGTTHVFRIFQNTGPKKTELLERIDWEPEEPEIPGTGSEPKTAWIQTGNQIPDGLTNLLSAEKAFDAVVIKDLCKGVVCDATMKWLSEHNSTKGANWYISSKSFAPEWLSCLKDVSLRLLLIPQVAAEAAVRSQETATKRSNQSSRESKGSALLGKLSTWITNDGRITYEALTAIDELTEPFKMLQTVVVLPCGQSVAARIGTGSNAQLLVRSKNNGVITEELAFASVLLPALITADLCKYEGDWTKSLRAALKFTDEWEKSESKRVDEPQKWNGAGEKAIRLEELSDEGVEGWKPSIWETERIEWEAATSGLGVIK